MIDMLLIDLGMRSHTRVILAQAGVVNGGKNKDSYVGRGQPTTTGETKIKFSFLNLSWQHHKAREKKDGRRAN
jgi:hypothetical protein